MVLTIIGLLLGGVMKASAMIENRQIQKDFQALQSFQAAYMLYKDQYGSMPGKDPNKPGRLLTTLSTEPEPTQGLFYDLHRSGFIHSVNPKPQIGTAFKSTWGGSSGENYGLIAQKNQICITEVDVNLGQWLETKMDDANRSAGEIEYTLSGSQLCMRLQ